MLICPYSYADDLFYKISRIVAFSAHGADLATTEYCLGAHKCVELNHYYARFNNPAWFGVAKFSVVATEDTIIDTYHKNYPESKWPAIINYAIGGVFTGIAIHNSSVIRNVR